MQILAGQLQGLCGLFDSTDAEQVIAQQKLQVSVKAVEVGSFGEAFNLLKKDIVIRIETARVENTFFFRQNLRQSCPKELGSFGIFLIGEQGLTVGKRKYHIIGRKVDCSGEHISGRAIIAGFEGLDGTFEVAVGEVFRVGSFSSLLGKLFANVREGGVVNRPDTICCLIRVNGNSTTVGVVIVGVVVVRISRHFASKRIIAVPAVRVAAIPVIAAIPVPSRPVATQTDENVFAVIVRINIPKREAISPTTVVQKKTIPGPYCSVAQAVTAVNIYILTVINVSYFIGTVMVYHCRRPSSVLAFEAVNNCVSAAFCICTFCSDVLTLLTCRPDALAPFGPRTREQRGDARAYADSRLTDRSNFSPSDDR